MSNVPRADPDVNKLKNEALSVSCNRWLIKLIILGKCIPIIQNFHVHERRHSFVFLIELSRFTDFTEIPWNAPFIVLTVATNNTDVSLFEKNSIISGIKNVVIDHPRAEISNIFCPPILSLIYPLATCVNV